MMIILVGMATLQLFVFQKDTVKNIHAEELTEYKQLDKQRLTVILQLFYLDGEVTEEMVTEDVDEIDELWNEYKDWNLVDINTEHVVFKKDINDISPLLKANGYFGLTEDGTLTIFNGKPEKNKVIQSFYQLDIEKLESYEQKQLKNGIPVRTKNDFQKVLNAFKPYSRTTDQ